MTLDNTMAALKAAGTAQNRKVYARHGVRREMFGVSFAELQKLAKKIKRDHRLARALWQTGNHDAQVLATYIADPATMSAKELNEWLKDLDNYVAADMFSRNIAARSEAAAREMVKWMKSKSDHIGQVGWNLLSIRTMSDMALSDDEIAPMLTLIEKGIHKAKNRTRYSMNSALIAAGVYRPGLRPRALAVASAIGKVEVDHGETGCKTPDAAAYIAKSVEQIASRRKPVKRTH